MQLPDELSRQIKDLTRRVAKQESYDSLAKAVGTAFPYNNLYTNRPWRNTATGINLDFYYSGVGGSEWRSSQLFSLLLEPSNFGNPAAMPGAGNSLYSGMPVEATWDYWVEAVNYYLNLTNAHSGVNYFTINYPGTSTTSNTQTGAVGENRFNSSFSPYLISGVKPVGTLAYRPFLTQVGTPTGTAQIIARCNYRLVRPIPRDVTGLVLWLRPEELANLTDGTAVATWPDASGNSNDATQGTGANQPLYKTNIQNGRAIVRFDGSNDFMQIANPGSFDLATYTIFVVGKVTSGSGGSFIGKNDAAFVDGRRRHLQIQAQNTGSDMTHFAGTDAQNINKTGISWGSFHVAGVVARSTTDVSLIVDGTETTYSTPTLDFTSYNGKNVTIGRPFLSTSAEHLNGDIAEILIYNSALSTNDWTKVVNYLRGKWGI